ncbi:MAG TPA: hypothetical protein VL832_13145 [Puia sp.]|jgi:hypothetical protein|nr:hypothetical protein [Puia sp.]
MKKGKSSTVFILALEIAAIAVLHAVKISQNEKNMTNKEISRNITTHQPDVKARSVYSLAVFK